jgi:hypothetical protein
MREDVHLRIREPDPRRPHRLQPPTSAVSVRGTPRTPARRWVAPEFTPFLSVPPLLSFVFSFGRWNWPRIRPWPPS